VVDRCEVIAADFFVSVPAGGDAYVLSQIICDWPDEEALAILRICHQAMAPGARLWLLEIVVPPKDQIDPDLALFDLTILTLLGARRAPPPSTRRCWRRQASRRSPFARPRLTGASLRPSAPSTKSLLGNCDILGAR
jgi:hypothetical protein